MLLEIQRNVPRSQTSGLCLLQVPSEDVAVSMLSALIVTMESVGSSPACSEQKNCTADDESKDYCYSARIRSTVLQGLPFGGVPTVLALDFMCFLVSLSSLRRAAH